MFLLNEMAFPFGILLHLTTPDDHCVAHDSLCLNTMKTFHKYNNSYPFQYELLQIELEKKVFKEKIIN